MLNLVIIMVYCFMFPQFHAAAVPAVKSPEMSQFRSNIESRTPIEVIPIQTLKERLRNSLLFSEQDFQDNSPCLAKRNGQKTNSLKNQSFLITLLKFLENKK